MNLFDTFKQQLPLFKGDEIEAVMVLTRKEQDWFLWTRNHDRLILSKVYGTDSAPEAMAKMPWKTSDPNTLKRLRKSLRKSGRILKEPS